MNRLIGIFSIFSMIVPMAALAHGAEPHDHGASGAHDHDHGSGGAHSHESPHGGEVVDIGDIHAEVVFGEGALLVYFYDADMKPIPAPANGKATLAVGKEVKKGELLGNVDHLAGPLGTPAKGKATAVVQATVAGKARTIRAERLSDRGSAEVPYHDHRSLRGGLVGMSGDDHVELLAEKGGVYKVWFTDGHRKPITQGVSGKLVVTSKDGSKEEIPLTGPGVEGVLVGKGKAADGDRKVELDGIANGHPFRYPFEIRAGS